MEWSGTVALSELSPEVRLRVLQDIAAGRTDVAYFDGKGMMIDLAYNQAVDKAIGFVSSKHAEALIEMGALSGIRNL